MTINRKWLIGGLAVAVLGAAAAGAVARHGGHGWGHHGGGKHYGWYHRRHGKRNPMRMLCNRRAPERVDHMLVRIKHKAQITDQQTPAFEDFANTVRTAAAKARESCPPKPDWKKRNADSERSDAEEAKPRLRRSPIERLDNMEKMLAATLEAVRTVRPSAEALYASLTPEQQENLRKVRGKHRWWKRKHRRGGRDGHGKHHDERSSEGGRDD